MLQVFSCMHNCAPLLLTPSLVSNTGIQVTTTPTHNDDDNCQLTGEFSFSHICPLTDIHAYMHIHSHSHPHTPIHVSIHMHSHLHSHPSVGTPI